MSRADRLALAVVVGFFAVAYGLYGLFRHWNFGSSAFDLGIFDQVVWHLSRFEPPASSIRGFNNFLGDHFFPVIALFAPYYWIRPGPATLIVVQALGSAASIVAQAAIVPHLSLRERIYVLDERAQDAD